MPSITEHLLSSNISFAEHVRKSEICLGKELAGKRAVYLDTKYWILLRDANQGNGTLKSTELLGILKRGVEEDKVFCPISPAVFIELLRQRSLSSRLATAELIDQLSLGSTFIGIEEIVYIEIEHFIRSTAGLHISHPLENLVWRKLSYVLGVPIVTNEILDPTTDLAIQKSFFDHMWTISLREVVETIGDTISPESHQQEFARKMNADISEHSDELRSFQQAYAAEARGIVDELGGLAFNVMRSIAQDQGIVLGKRDLNDRGVSENRWKNLLFFALVRNRARHLLRTLNIKASLYASLRWNKGRKFKANDLFDFSHASAALAYCDAFFTERSLHTMVTQQHVALDRLYRCYVASSEDDPIRFLSKVLE